jgi:hypothetical protein
LHHNVLAIALANKLARIAWAVLNKGAPSSASRRRRRRPDLPDPRAVLGAVKARGGLCDRRAWKCWFRSHLSVPFA